MITSDKPYSKCLIVPVILDVRQFLEEPGSYFLLVYPAFFRPPMRLLSISFLTQDVGRPDEPRSGYIGTFDIPYTSLRPFVFTGL